MNILVVGSLGPFPDRIFALSALGHNIVYAYTEFQSSIIEMQPRMPCIPLPRRYLPEMVRFLIELYEIQVIYSLLNAIDESTEATLELLDSGLNVPIVRHYKEHPCIATVEERRVLLETEGQIYINEESFEYFRKAYKVRSSSAYILDADMIPEWYMLDNFSDKLRSKDSEPHLLVAGGLSVSKDRFDLRELCVEMNRRKVHVHLYGYMIGKDQNHHHVIHHVPTKNAYEKLASANPYTHLHEYIMPNQFSAAWSQYDAGFMHAKVNPSNNEADFERMNLPNRYSAYLAAGLPLVVEREGQEAMQRFSRQHGIGIVFRDYDDLAEQLHDESMMSSLCATVTSKRKSFAFDAKAHDLARILQSHGKK